MYICINIFIRIYVYIHIYIYAYIFFMVEQATRHTTVEAVCCSVLQCVAVCSAATPDGRRARECADDTHATATHCNTL